MNIISVTVLTVNARDTDLTGKIDLPWLSSEAYSYEYSAIKFDWRNCRCVSKVVIYDTDYLRMLRHFYHEGLTSIQQILKPLSMRAK
jgi:hypothetical protein